MDTGDIRKNILLRYDDIDELINSCFVDKLSHTICSTKSFWEDKYSYDNLIFKKFYGNLHLDTLEYKYSRACFDRVLILLTTLLYNQHNNSIRIFIRGIDDAQILDIPELIKIYYDNLYKYPYTNYNSLALVENELYFDIYTETSDVWYLYTPTMEKYSISYEKVFDILYDVCYKKMLYEYVLLNFE
jgi:hypothetical protein